MPIGAAHADQRQRLGELLQTARSALSNRELGKARRRIAEARGLAQSDEHLAMVQRLEQLAALLSEFLSAVDRSVASLTSGAEIPVSNTTTVMVVERSDQELVLRISGENRTYPLDQLPPALMIALAAQQLGADQPRFALLKGAFAAVHLRAGPQELARVRELWQEASQTLPEAQQLLPVLDDEYDLR
jgi:hypothetical protein